MTGYQNMQPMVPQGEDSSHQYIRLINEKCVGEKDCNGLEAVKKESQMLKLVVDGVVPTPSPQQSGPPVGQLQF